MMKSVITLLWFCASSQDCVREPLHAGEKTFPTMELCEKYVDMKPNPPVNGMIARCNYLTPDMTIGRK